MSILAKVANRPRPKVNLGPVDFTCSFCFVSFQCLSQQISQANLIQVDVLRHDNPIVYASPSFYELTGYSEAEVLGKNCRFLQHPEGKMEKGSVREHTSPDAVQIMRKSLLANKECQVSLVNFRKGGKAFVNLVTVIPVPGKSAHPSAVIDISIQKLQMTTQTKPDTTSVSRSI
jgi:PAS domain S-box-containing protein